MMQKMMPRAAFQNFIYRTTFAKTREIKVSQAILSQAILKKFSIKISKTNLHNILIIIGF